MTIVSRTPNGKDVPLNPYLVAAVDGGVLANTVNLAAGAVVDNVVRGTVSVARHDYGYVVVFEGFGDSLVVM